MKLMLQTNSVYIFHLLSLQSVWNSNGMKTGIVFDLYLKKIRFSSGSQFGTDVHRACSINRYELKIVWFVRIVSVCRCDLIWNSNSWSLPNPRKREKEEKWSNHIYESWCLELGNLKRKMFAFLGKCFEIYSYFFAHISGNRIKSNPKERDSSYEMCNLLIWMSVALTVCACISVI